jgi:3'-phosphoadenosine 5'-phosphosulfate sulfotransferase (PAPS reductase)/FAD synthetase
MRVLSLGWGVQSWTLAAMAALGEIEPVDVALHSDTTWERAGTYAFAAEQTAWLEARGVRVVTVRPECAESVDRFGGVRLPAFTLNGQTQGQIKRQCTGDWKIAPMRRWLQAHRNGQTVTLLRGISFDEWQRAKDSDVKYIVHEHPLIDLRMSRADCILWLQRHGLPVPPRSACVMCPFQTRREWRSLGVSDVARAIQADEAVRGARPPAALFLHPSLRPLAEIDLRSEQEAGQTELWAMCADGECMT